MANEKIKISTTMDNKRLAKIERLIQKELSEIFRRQTAMRGGLMVTVSGVRVTPDLSIAKAYLSIFPSGKAAEVLENIKKQTKNVRYELAQAVKSTLRKCPDLQFYLDDSLDYVDHIDAILKKEKEDHPSLALPPEETPGEPASDL